MNIFNLLLLVLNLSASAINSKPSDAPVLNYSSLDENQITETAVSSSFDTDSFQYKYFKNLNSNMPINTQGICGYVGISMMLSYLDTYYSDLFIPENMEVRSNITSSTYYNGIGQYESPGVIDTLQYNNFNNYRNYTNPAERDYYGMKFVITEINNLSSILGDLFEIALENNLINHHRDLEDYETYSYSEIININPQSNNYFEGLGVSYNIVDTVLRNYISSTPNNNYFQVVSGAKANESSQAKEQIRNEVIYYIRRGIPVLCGVNYLDSNGSKPGHEVVAYYYDEENDIIYGNLGYKGSYNELYSGVNTCVDLYARYNLGISDYWAVIPNITFENQITNNYYFTDKQAPYSPNIDSCFIELVPTQAIFGYDYVAEETTKLILLSNPSRLFTTTFKRCRYEGEGKLSLSPGGAGAWNGEAFLQITTSTLNINGLHLELSFNFENEYTHSENSTYIIQEKINNERVENTNIWELNIPNSTSDAEKIYITFSQETNTFKIDCSSAFQAFGNYSKLLIHKLYLLL